MSTATNFPVYLKSLAQSTSGTSFNYLMEDGNGNIKKVAPCRDNLVSLTGKESKDTVLPLKEFVMKYIEGLPVGSFVTDPLHSITKRWYIQLKEGLNLDVQYYMILVTTNSGSLNDPYAYISFIMFPSVTGKSIYHVYLNTKSVATEFECQIYVTEMTKL